MRWPPILDGVQVLEVAVGTEIECLKTKKKLVVTDTNIVTNGRKMYATKAIIKRIKAVEDMG